MTVRILHCGKNFENYNICINEKIFGFINNSAEEGDIIYLVIKINKISYCGAKAVLSQTTDFKPWPDGESYSKSFTIKDLTFCEPFDIKILSEVGGKFWSLKFIQGSKPIKEIKAIKLLEDNFTKVNEDKIKTIFKSNELITNEDETEDEVTLTNLEEVLKEVPDSRIKIMATFQTINFINETDPIRGIEALVNENFYSLFPSYKPERSILIPENRLFRTSGFQDSNSENISGIRGIPDGLLITFNKDLKPSLQINIIEYECFGEKRTRVTDKSNYMNTQIIPQLMRFASSFSVVTDDKTRNLTINNWVDKIIDYIYSNEKFQKLFSEWMKLIFINISEQLIALKIKEVLLEAFKTNLKVILIIDELNSDQRDTIKNVINSFKLENGKSIEFLSYIVRLTQKINIIDREAEFALSVQ